MPYGNTKISQEHLESRRKNRKELQPPPFDMYSYNVKETDYGYWNFKGFKGVDYKVHASDFAPYDVWWSYFQDNERVARESFVFDKLLKKGDVFMDVGAYVGAWTMAALANEVSMVYAYEVDPRFFKELKLNVELNGYSAFLHNWGLYSENKESDWYDSEDWGQPAKFRKLDEQFPGSRLDFVKIDTEGAELHVLWGGIETFRKFKPNFWIECHLEWDKDIVNKILRVLISIDSNYIIEPFQLDPNTIHILVSRPTRENKRYMMMRKYNLDQLLELAEKQVGPHV